MRGNALPAQLHDETLLTTEQVAALTNISRHTFEGWRYHNNGGPKYTKLGPQIIRYRWADIKSWRDSGAVSPVSNEAMTSGCR